MCCWMEGLLKNKSLQPFIIYFCVRVYHACTHTYHGALVWVRGQRFENPFFSPVLPGDQIQATGLVLYLLSLLTGTAIPNLHSL